MKDKSTALILAFFLGSVGAHHYYLGNTKRGLFYTFLCITLLPAVLAIFDFALLLVMKKNDFHKKYNKEFIIEPQVDYSRMKDLFDLKEKGVINEEEYEREKAKLIA